MTTIVNKDNIRALVETIQSAEAVELKDYKYRIDVIFKDGTRETIKKAGNLPGIVNAYDFQINGNAPRGTLSKYFNFARKIPSHYADSHIQGFIPTIVCK